MKVVLTISITKCRKLEISAKQLTTLSSPCHVQILRITVRNVNSTLNAYAMCQFFRESNYIHINLGRSKHYFASYIQLKEQELVLVLFGTGVMGLLCLQYQRKMFCTNAKFHKVPRYNNVSALLLLILFLKHSEVPVIYQPMNTIFSQFLPVIWVICIITP